MTRAEEAGASSHGAGALLEVDDLKTHFLTFEGVARAVDGVSFHLAGGETLGLVGESGCGKSVTALTAMGLIKTPPGRIAGGRIRFKGQDLLCLSPAEMRHIRGNRISMIFQEPMTSLNPVFTVGDQIAEMFVFHRQAGARESRERAVEMLRKVQIPNPEKRAGEYPHQLSGGMRQRAMIAMALACDPEILIADEPTTALDVTIQAQILELMLQLKQDTAAAIIMITHDLGIIAETAQRVVVMYAGRVVEEASTAALFEEPLHPYTQGLLRSVPRMGHRARYGRQRLAEIEGMVPSLYELPEGCAFHPRCREARAVCRREEPQIRQLDGGRRIRCWQRGG
ncbi:MAG: ABC transporter ATP-binding protein [Desulfobacterales bacterium]|nr:ABC transporter ATP-binding protein [Desulfobacterales bacterium]